MSAAATAALAGLAAYALYRAAGATPDPAATKRLVEAAVAGAPEPRPTLPGLVFVTGDTPLAEPDLAPAAVDKQSAFAYAPLPPVRSNWDAVRRPVDQRQALENLW